MKKLILMTLLVSCVGMAFGGHYHIVLDNPGANGFKKCDEKVDEVKNTYSYVCSEDGPQSATYKSLKESKLKEYISETGRVHNILTVLKGQMAILKKANVMVSRLDSDMFAFSRRENGITTIDIYTGEDAKKNEHLINSKQ